MFWGHFGQRTHFGFVSGRLRSALSPALACEVLMGREPVGDKLPAPVFPPVILLGNRQAGRHLWPEIILVALVEFRGVMVGVEIGNVPLRWLLGVVLGSRLTTPAGVGACAGISRAGHVNHAAVWLQDHPMKDGRFAKFADRRLPGLWRW